MTYTSFWPDSSCAEAIARGREGQVIERIWGGWNQGTYYGTIRPGDRVVLVGQSRGCMYVFGRVDVAEVLTAEAWIARGLDPKPDYTSGTVIIGVAGSGTPLVFNRGLPGSYLDTWEFETIDADPRPFKGVEDGIIKRGLQMQATVRITLATAAPLHDFIDHGDLRESDDPTLARLERALHEASHDGDNSEDWDTMGVYVDALLAAGDPRGEIAALERQVVESGGADKLDDATNLGLAKKLWRLGNKHMPALCGRPGGFPFRTNWALHRVEPKAPKA